MGFIGTPKMSTNAFSQLLSREHSIRFHYGLLRMDPLRFNWVEPGALCGEQERQNTDPLVRLLDLLIVPTNPLAHHLADMPGGIVPDQQPMPFSLRSQTLTTRLQKLDRDRAHRSSSDKAQPDLRTVWVIWRPVLPQDARRKPRLLDRDHSCARIVPPGARGALCFA